MRYRLDQLAIIKYGKDQKKVISETGSIPIYGTGGLVGYATDSLYDKPSVLIGRKGTIEKVQYITQPFWTIDTLFYTIVNEKIVRPHFLYYLISQLDLKKYNEGTTIPSLRTETLNKIEFNIPSFRIQDKILEIIEPIENKIILNNIINDNLAA
ncbi:restriction endonuclease subunit S [uncultured Akkermansia sp.]|uniref:restriction endonuclease subunit S n=1 Tax=uncultured Akkermansia sp. TaxID=512294 RepID=UPI002594F368|nr:restriction endonuclease subunit S [uncultured Akkermansia sp.]